MSQVQIFGNLYTSGVAPNQKLASYNLEDLDLKGCVARVNKVSLNGVALTLAVTLSTPYESKVSKAASEKGVLPVKKEPGDVILIEVNVAVVDDRKPGEKNGRCQTLINALTGTMTREGKVLSLDIPPTNDGRIVYLTFDGGAIPQKGIIKLATFKSYLEDPEESIIFIKNLDESEVEEDSQVAKELEALKGSAFVEKASYQKGKTFEQLFLERLDLVEGMIMDPDGKLILRLANICSESVDWDEESAKGGWSYTLQGRVETIILTMLRG